MINATNPEIVAQTRIELGNGLALIFGGTGVQHREYPSNRIQKGLLMVSGNRPLSEEGVGFGVPILKKRCNTIFPGSAQVSINREGDSVILVVDYALNMIERMRVKGRRIDSETFYRVIDYFASAHRRWPALRRTGTSLSNVLRRTCGFESQFEVMSYSQNVRVVYTIQTNRKSIRIDVDLNGLRRERESEITIANEQGANYFSRYRDSNGLDLAKDDIGTWNETSADEASFIDGSNHISFSMRHVQGARMFRGRELVSDRLAWSGLDYVLPKHLVSFHYTIDLGATNG